MIHRAIWNRKLTPKMQVSNASTSQAAKATFGQTTGTAPTGFWYLNFVKYLISIRLLYNIFVMDSVFAIWFITTYWALVIRTNNSKINNPAGALGKTRYTSSLQTQNLPNTNPPHATLLVIPFFLERIQKTHKNTSIGYWINIVDII